MTPRTAACQVTLSFTITQSLLKFMSMELVMPSNHLILCCPFLLLPSIFPSIRGFSNESALRIRWTKYWSFSISSSNEHSGLISFRIDCFVLFKLTISPNYLTSITVSLEQFEKFSCSRNCEHFLSPHHALQLPCNPEENSLKPFFLAEAICMYFSFRKAQSEKAIRVSATYHLEHVFIKLLRIAEENLLKVKCK